MVNLEQSTTALPGTLARLDHTLARLDSIAASSEPEIEMLLIELNATLRNLREITATGKFYGSSLVFGKAPPRVTPGGDN
jgi:hypothetical protein